MLSWTSSALKVSELTFYKQEGLSKGGLKLIPVFATGEVLEALRSKFTAMVMDMYRNGMLLPDISVVWRGQAREMSSSFSPAIVEKTRQKFEPKWRK
jgi:hypothetical protein